VSGVAPNGGLKPSTSPKRLAFPRGIRLLRHTDFEQVYRLGRRHFAAHITVFYRLRAESEGMRVGFTVGGALGGAVERNRIKRRLREAVRLQWPELTPAVDVVINPKKSALDMDFSELGKEVARAFEVIQRFAEKQLSRPVS
jgi:ribonuclease P protein component